ncbi:MAG: protease modulator HflC [Faecousia sp.]
MSIDLKFNKKTVIILAIALFALVIALNSFYVVEEDEHACTVRFSEIIDTKSEAGLYFKVPFLDSVKYFPKATMLYDIQPSEVFTSDKQNMTVDCYVLWRISDPKLFYRSLGSTTVAEDRMNALTYTELKNVMSTLAQADIINMEDGAKRNEIYDGIAKKVSQQATVYGIEITDVKIKQFDLPASNLSAVYSRMISERNQKAEMYTANGKYDASIIRNDVDKQVNILISNAEASAAKLVAEGEAEYMRLLAAAYNDPAKKEFYEFTLALDALEKSLQGGEKTIILDADSPLAKILIGSLDAAN